MQGRVFSCGCLVIVLLTKMPALCFFPTDEGVYTKTKNILDKVGVSSDALKLSPPVRIFHLYSWHEVLQCRANCKNASPKLTCSWFFGFPCTGMHLSFICFYFYFAGLPVFDYSEKPLDPRKERKKEKGASGFRVLGWRQSSLCRFKCSHGLSPSWALQSMGVEKESDTTQQLNNNNEKAHVRGNRDLFKINQRWLGEHICKSHIR